MKICTICKRNKNEEDFGWHRKGISKRAYCKKCNSDSVTEKARTIDGLIGRIYNNQIATSKKRNLGDVEYTKQELTLWLLSNKDYLRLFKLWKDSGYNRELVPSCDRHSDKKDYDYLPYSLDRLRVVPFFKNREKGALDIKSGINNKTNIAVVKIDKTTNKVIESFFSITNASENTKISISCISDAITGRQKTAGGFLWKKDKDIS